MRIDAHQHFWRYDPNEVPWIQEDWPIRRDFLPTDLQPELEAHGFDGCIAVQARQTLAETRWLLKLSDEFPIIKGVVGWVDLRSNQLDEQLAEFSENAKLVGVRHVVQDEPDDAFMQREAFQRGISRLAEFGLVYDILIHARQLPAAIELVRAFPEQSFVLDHVAKPLIRDGIISPWQEHIHELAAYSNVVCKVSGLITEAAWTAWQPMDFSPYLATVLAAFGPDRILYGSDWPVALLAGTYHQVFALAQQFAAPFDPPLTENFFGGTATRIYQL